MQAFFRRVKTGEKPGYPRCRGVNWFDTVEFPKDGDGCRWDSTPHDPVTRVRLQGVGHVRVHQHRRVKGRVKTVSVKREGRQWYVILACDEVPAEPLPATGAACGIDMGVAHFLTTSEGGHKPNPRHGKRNADALAQACSRDVRRRWDDAGQRSTHPVAAARQGGPGHRRNGRCGRAATAREASR
jgi:putative transposase